MSSFLQFQEQQESPFLLKPITFSFVSAFFIFFLVKWLFKGPSRSKNLPPSPPKFPIIGNFHQLGPLVHRSLQSLAQKHGPIMQLQLGSVPTLVISSAEAACEIMRTHDIIFANRPQFRKYKKLMYDGKDVSVAPYGEFWRQLKSIYLLQLLSNRRVQSFHRVRVEGIDHMMNMIEESFSLSLPVNLSEMFTSLTNDLISRAAFGRKYGEGESGKKFMQLLKDYLRLLGRFDIGDLIPWISWVSRVNGLDAEVNRVAKEIDEFLEEMIEDRVNALKKESTDSGSGEVEYGGSENFLDILLRIHKDDSTAVSIDRDSIKAVVLTTFAAGTDTTSTFLEWAMTELLRHPRVLKKVQIEVREVLKGKDDIADDFEKMLYLKAVMKETFRLHPPIPLLVPRQAREDVKVMGYDIAAGTMVIINAWAIGRDPALWDEPEEFRPERFLNSPIDFKGLDFQLIPFGAGRRGCPGITFAMAVNELVLANLLHKFDWALPGGAKAEDLDITECPGVAIHRRIPLLAVATPWSCW
ncbi:Cytochrome P450 71A8 like [Actinidia chinensis var. chinensis]|uniref:Cytochrome P450 71A8 like n=1 Tax=Actinidia chinensis var. chinensis TaxID=1590841 RepID=A0A2R6QGJ6_ACTCC|nr:Cytochrome P450 71A8 like [Actinidia chinensis var. chinensis]